jgi:hypothetical protein
MGGQEKLDHRDLEETRKTVKSGEAKKPGGHSANLSQNLKFGWVLGG